jgi:hypothetical protein
MCGNIVQGPDFWGNQQKGGAVHTANVRPHPDFPIRSYRVAAAFHLPEVSRQIYSETAMLTYTSNTFAVTYYTIRNFGRSKKSWPASLLLAHQRAVRTVILTWDHIWDCMQCFSWVNPIRKGFPNVEKIIITATGVEYVRELEWETEDPEQEMTREQWQHRIAGSLRNVHGDDIKIEFEVGGDFEPIVLSEVEDSEEDDDDADDA